MRPRMPEGGHYIEPSPFGTWVRSPAVRETVESVLIAILLALLFRFFEAEAYVIPTGSMAPNLQGQHVDVVCPKCGFDYRGGATAPGKEKAVVKRAVCPICQYPMILKRIERRDHLPFSGDRVLVNKFAYDFAPPERFDVIVFKYPNNGKQNFIKRLIGLPWEGILIENGDIYAFNLQTETFADRKIARKSPRKLRAMLQTVDDTNHIPDELIDVKWPSRWATTENNGTVWTVSDDYKQFSLENATDQTSWLRYRHFRPRRSEWDRLDMSDPELPERFRENTAAGELISDYYAYNDVYPMATRNGYVEQFPPFVGMHWVGDLAVEADLEILSENGQMELDLVEGGVHFRCLIDIASGDGSFSVAGNEQLTKNVSLAVDTSAFKAPITKSGKYKVLFANVDNKYFLFVDNKIVAECEYDRSGEVLPQYNPNEPGDAEPIGIGGSKGLKVQVSRLKVMRDIYYTSRNLSHEGRQDIAYEYSIAHSNPSTIHTILRTPSLWNSDNAIDMFRSRNRDEGYVFRMEENQYFPMGDNSPESKDARIWEGNHYVDGSYLLGEALFVYWPHAKTSPLPFWPNFGRMKLIR